MTIYLLESVIYTVLPHNHKSKWEINLRSIFNKYLKLHNIDCSLCWSIENIRCNCQESLRLSGIIYIHIKSNEQFCILSKITIQSEPLLLLQLLLLSHQMWRFFKCHTLIWRPKREQSAPQSAVILSYLK